MSTRPDLADKLRGLPTKPGVYLMKDRADEVIYVGKAINLRNRVRSYFHASADHPPKVQELVSRVADIEFIVTDSELEALILESTLIKKHRPRYNVRLKDDKRYPYIKITWQEDFPRIYVTRQMQEDGARYFGPYASVSAVHQTLDLLRRLFPYRTCRREISGQDRRPCLYYHIGRCLGPCIGAVSREEYRALIERVALFLEGRTEEIIAGLRQRMEAAAEALEFEKAAALRDQIRAIERVVERQKVFSLTGGDQDVIALARDDAQACVQVFFIRNGKLIGREYFVLEGAEGEDTRTVMASFLKQFYDEAAYVPPRVLLPEEVDEVQVIERWLCSKRGDRVILQVPREGQERELVEMAVENAVATLAALRAQWEAETDKWVTALTQLQEYLHLPTPPTRIEGYDISNLQGTAATGSMVVFVKGVPRKSDYRRFRIRTVAGADDYAMLQEVLRRRFRRLGGGEQEEIPHRPQETAWAVLPDLILVDGGKGQLNAALEVLREFGLDHLPVVGLAKREEELFLPGQSEPVVLPRHSPALFLVQRVRDEAHRFAVSYHRTVRRSATLASVLEEIPDIGPRRRRALLKHFGSLEAIRRASVEELAAVPGMTRRAAEQVKEHL